MAAVALRGVLKPIVDMPQLSPLILIPIRLILLLRLLILRRLRLLLLVTKLDRNLPQCRLSDEKYAAKRSDS
jgi:hypothetical protein